MRKKDNLKEKILPHRAYRIIKLDTFELIGSFIAIFLIFIAVFSFFPLILEKGIEFCKEFLDTLYVSAVFEINHRNFLIFDVPYIETYGKYPTKNFAILTLIVSFILAIALYKNKYLKNISMTLFVLVFINILSALYFIFFSQYFPYSLSSFSYLFISTSVINWAVLMFIFGLLIAPIPANFFLKIIVYILISLSVVVLGFLRYLLIIVVLKEYTYIFMPVLFLGFGIIVDYVYAVMLYGFFVSFVTASLLKKVDEWRWVE
ncbi:hypothetical protein [Persephonella sp. KM09-Lau-8]|uniref:hypothetical protein n=1 Tax=Persephonella sp. KM09-Lau-8 TaxID=1158345 RepID=UPI0004985E4F|nr:hypothetical protein [Persephonella sp. KM09-Lau-8]